MNSMWIHFSFALILFYIAWFYFWRKVHLEDAIDKLFCLRDRVRETFIKNDYSLETDTYQITRDLLNSHIKFIDEISVFSLWYGKKLAQKKPMAYDAITKEIETRLSTNNDEINNFLAEVRKEAVYIMYKYLLKTSLILIIRSIIFVLTNSFKKPNKEQIEEHYEYIEEMSYSERYNNKLGYAA